jgi:hypothetical protein
MKRLILIPLLMLSACDKPEPKHLATVSIVSCLTRDCEGGAVWEGVDVMDGVCDFKHFESQISEQFNKGRFLTLTCTSEVGEVIVRELHMGDEL